MRTIDNHSALSRARATSSQGLRMNAGPAMSTYVIFVKLKKAINEEFSAENWRRYLRARNYSKNTHVSRAWKVDKLVNRLDALSPEALPILFDAYTQAGVLFLVRLLDLPMAKMRHTHKFKQEVECTLGDHLRLETSSTRTYCHAE